MKLKKQFDFIVSNTLRFYDRVSETLHERDGCVDCLYLNLIRCHRILLWQLKHLRGVKGKLLDCMKMIRRKD